ncbi:MAG: preprotein translocase subunit SecG [Caulobacteraceae bacterium]
MLLGLLLTLNILVCLALIGVVLLQRSEGGALGTGSPTGLITTRGAGDLLTRTTWVLFALFLGLSLALTLIGGRERSSQAILNRLKLQSVNPDALAGRAPPAGASGQATPPPVQAPAGSPARGLSAPTPTVAPSPAGTAAPRAAPVAGSPLPTVALAPMTGPPAKSAPRAP